MSLLNNEVVVVRGAGDLATGCILRLLRAGFRTGEILRALKKFAKNPDLLDGFEPPEEAEEPGS